MDRFDCLIVGAGAAGLMAAIKASEDGRKVCIVESNEKAGKKIYITGKGRCNLTNACDPDSFFDNIISNKKFMYSSYYFFDNFQTIEYFNSLGLPTKIERGDRVFPVSDKSSDVIKVLVNKCRENDVEVLYNTKVDKLIIEDGEVKGVLTSGGKELFAPQVIVATGGKSYPSTGSTGDGYRFARESGHEVTDLIPGLVPMNIKEKDCQEMQGLSMKNVELTYVDVKTGKTIYSGFGEMMFTHFGITGPLVLSASSVLGKARDVKVILDCKPALDDNKLDKRILRDFSERPNYELKNVLGALLPRSMVPVVIKRSGIDASKKVNSITKEERAALVNVIKRMEFSFAGFREFREAIITRGGVSIKDINPHTMESKYIKGLYFAGEVIDVDALTGGFNLQIAWSTGALAGSQRGE